MRIAARGRKFHRMNIILIALLFFFAAPDDPAAEHKAVTKALFKLINRESFLLPRDNPDLQASWPGIRRSISGRPRPSARPRSWRRCSSRSR